MKMHITNTNTTHKKANNGSSCISAFAPSKAAIAVLAALDAALDTALDAALETGSPPPPSDSDGFGEFDCSESGESDCGEYDINSNALI
jgi:hypothetical protein